ncbi:MAG TPA: hypothetical protein PKA85_06350 [Ferruginibacter sp.]|nr:hypothetical protein [Ferruginibacter sp.]
MKKVIISILVLIASIPAFAQVILPVDQIILRDKIKFKNYWVNGITNDTLFDDPNTIPTASAVRQFVEGRSGGSGALQNLHEVLSQGNNSNLGVTLRNSNMNVVDSFGTSAFRAYMNSLQFDKGSGNGTYIKWDNITGSRELQLPNLSGTIPLSVNGNSANTSGAITIPTFYTESYGSLTDNTTVDGGGLDLSFENMGLLKLAAATIRVNSDDSAYITAPNLLINGATFDNQNNTLRIGTPDDYGYINGGTFSTLIGWRTGEGNAGDYVDAFGTIAGYSNPYNHVGLYGFDAAANKDSQMVFSPHYKRIRAEGLGGSTGWVMTKNAAGDLVLEPPTGGSGMDSSEAAEYFAQLDHSHNLDELIDVNTTGKQNGSYIAWNSTTSQWEAKQSDSIQVGHGLKVENISDTPKLVLNLPPNTILGNIDNSDSGYSFLKFKNWIDTTYSGSITWTGTTAPSGTPNHRISASRSDKRVEVTIWLSYTTPGASVSAVSMEFPSWLPSPKIPTGYGGANAWLYTSSGFLSTSNTSLTTGRFFIKRNAANDGFEFRIEASAGNQSYATGTISYITND